MKREKTSEKIPINAAAVRNFTKVNGKRQRFSREMGGERSFDGKTDGF